MDSANWIVALWDSVAPSSLSPVLFGALVLCSYVTSAISATIGVGGGVTLMAIMLLVLPPATVLPIHGVVQAGSNVGRAVTMRQTIHRPIVLWFTVGAVAGVIVASFVFVTLPSRWLLMALGLFILWSLWAPRFRARGLSDGGFSVAGMIVTFSGMFLGATGPLMAAFLHNRGLARQWLVATQAASMCVMHLLRVLAFGIIGFAYTDWIGLIVLMVVSGYAGTLSGKSLLARLPEAQFSRLFRIVLSILALRLVWTATFGN